ncbi:chemotaxis protein CheW [Mariniblastus fucicola]|uniref:CheW-like domain protein n=1 Tax=Mariniblastus fucicola TaxID=980251 RepID=A0A5B9P890_9BACT|nr:chemotaxis protein CheW [Mariniblastus fucicola]QEG21435.1 CheW-like domain protein [Mariniblastus fucicola]
MLTQTPTLTEAFHPEQLSAGRSNQFVRVRIGEIELVMGTKYLSGVYQASRQHRLTENNTVLTPKGEFPVASLNDVLQQKLNLPITSFEGRALIAVGVDGQVGMLRADSVSRPASIRPAHVHPMPKVAHDESEGSRLIRSVVNVEPSAANPNDCVRLEFDPRVALGMTVPAEPADQPNPLPKEAASAIAAAVAATSRRGSQDNRKSGQLLAFIPDDVAKSEVEQVFCLPLTAVAEVVTTQRHLNSTVSSDVFDGFVLWRKVPVPIVQLGKIFGFNLERETESSRRLVIARATGNRFLGFYAQPQMQTMKVPESVPGSNTLFEGRPHLGCFRTELGELVVPDLNRILDNGF